jgi:hypothetical protein
MPLKIENARRFVSARLEPLLKYTAPANFSKKAEVEVGLLRLDI